MAAPFSVERKYELPDWIQWDDYTYRGDAYATYGYGCDVAELEVDPDTYEVRPVRVTAVQEFGRPIHPALARGQIEGGTAQGIGLALMEEIQTRDGLITNASFTDYLIPTALDMPPVESVLIEDPEPDAPYGVKGVGEPPTVVSSAAIVSALRDAPGRELTRIPVRPDDICL